MVMLKEYYLGIDMGTGSVGWAVTDMEYRLLRAKGKDLWGIRLFETANTSVDRRVSRVARRRRQREVARIGILKELFENEIRKVDDNFYERLQDSKYHLEDKKASVKYAIFADKSYTDQQYYQDYPTIFHLRKELLESKNPHDVRLLYLALLNMFKHRGHFLNKNLSVENQSDELWQLYQELNVSLQSILGFEFDTTIDVEQFEEILSKKDISRSKKAEELAVLFQVQKSKEKNKYEVLKAISGLSLNLYVLLGSEYLNEENKKLSVGFQDGNYDDTIVKVQDALSENVMDLVFVMKQIHDFGLLASVMKGSQFLSQARVKSYEKHADDLKKLKRIILEFKPEVYDDMFRNDKKGSYSAYVGSTNSDKKKRRISSKARRDELYSEIKKILKSVPEEDADGIYIKKEIEVEGFLPKQLTAANGVIPNQVHAKEMKQILLNAEEYMGFLSERDKTGLSVTEKILQLYTFQIPYYIGPLSEQHKGKGGNAWVVRKEDGKVYPWNFEEKIDTKASAEAFITKMVRHCTYLQDETALPKNSLLYERFMVLNELNNLKIRGVKPSAELKQEIYKDLFQKGKKVKQSQLQKYLCGRGILEIDENDAISGIDTDFQNSLASFGRFQEIFGSDIYKDDFQEIVEQIIFWGTIYGDDKKFLRERIKEAYGECISKEQVKRIVGLKFKDWGRLSREFLEMSGCNKIDGEAFGLIQMMWETNYNLMELLSAEYTYIDELHEKCKKVDKQLLEIEYEDLEGMYLSVPVKRMVWQTILILKELEDVLGGQPKKIFVEMTRSDGEKGKRTKSRKAKFMELYKGCKDDARAWSKEIESKEEADFRSKKLYLYYTQKGRCMYSGEKISISELFDDNKYDIDHIYPRHFVKDDSIENNLVLVKKQINAHKSDNYPIEIDIYSKCHLLWKSLLSRDMKDAFITREKYNRLINRNPLTDEQLAGFINRQIVETGQGTKTITQILNQVYGETEVVFVKAGNVSTFRHDQKLIKCRAINDFHHAQDAYLNIVVGNVYHVKFTKNPRNFIAEYKKDVSKNAYHLSKMFNYSIRRGNEVAWVVNENGYNTKDSVYKVMRRNSPLITKMTMMGHGGLADQTLYSALKAKDVGYIPLKSSDKRMIDVKKYGGFSSATTAFFSLIEHEKKGKQVRSIETIPLYLCGGVKSEEVILKYCIEQLGLIKPQVRLQKIPLQSLIRRNGCYMRITGKTGNQLRVSNAMPLYLDIVWNQYVRDLEKMLSTGYCVESVTKKENEKLYQLLTEKHLGKLYRERPNAIGDKLNNKKEIFSGLEVNQQAKVLMQVLQLTVLGNLGADLQLIEEASKAGITLISKNICDAEEFRLIHQSPAGLYTHEIDLLTV